MKRNNQSWNRLAKNLMTLIVVVTIALFFIWYKPTKTDVVQPPSDSLSFILDTVPVNNNIVLDTLINPNNAMLEDFLKVGFSEKQAISCIHYREKGGVFRTKTDLKKIYSINDADYERVESYVFIPEKEQKPYPRKEKEQKNTVPKQKKTIPMVSINDCDEEDLKQLPYIGDFRAKKIVELRERLGGFYSAEQLHSVYSMDSSVVSAIEPYIIIDESKIRKINLNTATFKELLNHPLVNYDQTKAIFDYKKIVGSIKNIDELWENNIIPREEVGILKFYVKTND